MPRTPPRPAPVRLPALAERVALLEARAARAARARPRPSRPGDAGLAPAERVARVLDPGGPWFEIGALRGHDAAGDGVAGADFLTGIGTVGGRPVAVAAIVPRAAGGALGPEAVAKLLRIQEVALRQRIPLAYLLEGGAARPGLVDGHFPGAYGPGRALALASAMRRTGCAAQIAGCVGPMAGFGGLLAGLADRVVPIDAAGLAAVRAALAALPPDSRVEPARRPPRPPAIPAGRLGALLPPDHRRSYDMGALLQGLLDEGQLDEFQPRVAAEMLCGHGWIEGRPVAVIANRRGVIPARAGPPRIGGIIYTESAAKTAYFIEAASRQGLPLLFVHDVSGFMLGVEAEHSGIVRSGAALVEAMATARSARIALTVNHASGAGYYAMASQGFEPDFTLAWPTGRIGAMEAESAVTAVHGKALAQAGGTEASAAPAVRASIAAMRASFERELEATHAAARGHVDAIVVPEATRSTLAFLLDLTARPARRG